MNRPVCVQCRCEFRPEQNGFYIEEMAAGNRPYRLWYADLWECPGCRNQIVTGFANQPDACHWEEHYQYKRQRAQLQYWPRPGMVPSPTEVA